MDWMDGWMDGSWCSDTLGITAASAAAAVIADPAVRVAVSLSPSLSLPKLNAVGTNAHAHSPQKKNNCTSEQGRRYVFRPVSVSTFTYRYSYISLLSDGMQVPFSYLIVDRQVGNWKGEPELCKLLRRKPPPRVPHPQSLGREIHEAGCLLSRPFAPAIQLSLVS